MAVLFLDGFHKFQRAGLIALQLGFFTHHYAPSGNEMAEICVFIGNLKLLDGRLVSPTILSLHCSPSDSASVANYVLWTFFFFFLLGPQFEVK